MNEKPQGVFYKLKDEPLLKFLIISIVIYMAYGFYGKADKDIIAKENTVTITEQQIDKMVFGWKQRMNREPSAEELQKLVDVRVKETVLFEEAKKMGLDVGDVVLTRRVVLLYRNLVEGLIVPPAPTDQALEAYFQAHLNAYLPDELISFTQLFFDPDKREETTLDDANKVLVELQKLDNFPSNNLSKYGDKFMLANTYVNVSPLEIRKQFGVGFTKSLLQLETNVWIGPVLSGYGTHLVFIADKQILDAPLLEDIEETVLQDYLEEEKAELVKKYIENVIKKYNITIVADNKIEN